MGFLRPEKCIKTNVALAEQKGAKLRCNEKYLGYKQLPDGVIVVTTLLDGKIQTYKTKNLIISAGAWMPELLKKDELEVHRQIMVWFNIEEGQQDNFSVKNFPPFIWDLGEKGSIYGFPSLDGKSLKMGFDNIAKTTPDTINREVSEDEIQQMYEKFIKPNFKGISGTAAKSTVCMFTVAPRHEFDIDYIAGTQNKVSYASACSGHGAKFSVAVGESLANLALLGKSPINVIDLFGKKQAAPAPYLQSRL